MQNLFWRIEMNLEFDPEILDLIIGLEIMRLEIEAEDECVEDLK